jgi:putative transposase
MPWEKMVSLAQRRAVVAGAQAAFRVSIRRACRALLVHRSVITYRSVKPDDAPVRRRLHEPARDRPAFGVKRLHILLRRDGLRINFKKVRRLYQEEGLQLKPGSAGAARRRSASRAPRWGRRPSAGRWTSCTTCSRDGPERPRLHARLRVFA